MQDDCPQYQRDTANQDTRNGQASWQDILNEVEHDELVYKLVLKYLRQSGFDIGNYKMPRVIPPA